MVDILVKTPESNPVMKMIVPGRRALGETWREITITVRDDKLHMENAPSIAPPEDRPIMIPGMGNLPKDAIEHLLGAAKKAQEYRARKQRPLTRQEELRFVNEAWHDYVEQKIAAFKGVTQSGPSGWTQREKPDLSKVGR